MAKTSRSLRRRTLRPAAGAGSIEGAVLRRGWGAEVSVEIVGGPPRTVLDVHVDGPPARPVELDASGSGLLVLDTGPGSLPLEVRLDGAVLLRGRTPAVPFANPAATTPLRKDLAR